MEDGTRSSARHVVVVGAGITGAFAAFFLARDGARVTIVERGEVGGETSGNNPGGLNPLHGPGIPGPLQALGLASFRLHAEHRRTITGLSGIDFSPRAIPRVHVALDDGDVDALQRTAAPYDVAPGFSVRWLDREELLAREPRLTPAVRHGLWTDGNFRVDARAYTRAIVAASTKLGAKAIRAHARGLVAGGGRVRGVVCDAATIDCDGVVIASGPWCEAPARWLGISIPVEPIKGELLSVRPAGGALAVDVAWRDTALYRADDGAIWIGGTERRLGFDRSPSEEARASLLRRFGELMPGAQPALVSSQTAALRPVTPDDLPILGMASGSENVCLAVGGGRKGMLLGAAMGKAAADLTLRGLTDLPIAACAPARPSLGAGVHRGA